METLKLTEQNIQDQHICCAFSDKKVTEGYAAKKAWLKTEFANGYTFRKADVRGNVFIEYVPIEHVWLPLQGSNYMVINCFWVSGRFKGNGWGKTLLKQCIADAKAKGMDGIVAVSSDIKRPWMTDPGFLKKHGFTVVDEAEPIFKLYALTFNASSATPKFLDSARTGTSPTREGIAVYYSDTCPFTDYWNNQHLVAYAAKKAVPLTLHHLKTRAEAQQMPIPWIINSVFYNGSFVTLDVKPDRHLDALIG